MSCIPFWKGCNRNVDYVDRSRRGLNHVPDELLRYWRSLEELNLESNQIRDLPKGFYRLSQMRKLTLSDNQVVQLSPDVSNFIHLAELDISRNELTQIPENIKKCKCLQVADFSSNPLEQLPGGLMELTSLVKLCLNDVQMADLPASIGNLTNLETLELRDNFISSLPSSMSSLTSLRVLDLGGNTLQAIPGIIGCLSSLEDLRLECNDISYLPPEIGKLKKLTQLDLSENCLESIPREMGDLTCMTDLLLSYNQLEQLPDGIGNLRKMSTLKLDNNHLSGLPQQIGSCSSLQELILTENSLTELPPTVGRLKSLVILNVDRNQISSIPAEIGNCSRLSVLSLRDNKICSLPSELGNLQQLRVLDVSRNQLRYLPISLSSCNLKAIWLSESQAQPLLRFQQDIDEETGERVLTCFLLPQVVRATMKENAANASFSAKSDISSTSNSTVHQSCQSSVKFAEDFQMPHIDGESHLVRQCTPHPKDLRARHSRTSLGEKNSSRSNCVGTNQDSRESLIVPPPTSAIQLPAEEIKQPEEDIVDFRGWNGSSVKNDVLLVLESKSTKTEPALVMSRSDVGDDALKSASQLSLAISLLSDANTETSTAYDTARENLSDDTLTANDLSSTLDSDQDSIFDMPSGIDYKMHSCSSSMSDINIISVPPSIQTVIRVIRKPGTALGISIAGGRGSMPFIGNDDGIFISRVTPEGACDRAGLELGDKLISVNGENLTNATHRRAVNLLKNAGNDILMFVVKADMLKASKQKRSFQEDEISSADDVDSDSEDVDNNNDDIDNNNDCKTGDASVNTACCRFQLTNDSVRLPPRGKSLNELESHNNTMVADESDSTNASVESCSDVLCDESVDMQMPDDEPLIAELVSSDDDASHGVLPVLPDNYTANMYAQHDDVSSRDSSDERVCSADDTTSTASSLPHANKDHCDDELPFTDEQAVVRKRRSRIKPATDSLRKNQQGSDKITPYSGEIAEPSETSGKCDSSVEFNNDKQLQCYPVETVVIIKTDGILGMSIVGGKGQTSHPFGITEPGIFVSKIQAHGPAAKTSLAIGDRILSVNGNDLTNATHQEAVNALVAPKYRLTLLVRHDPRPAGYQEVVLELSPDEALGISIQGGCGSVCGNRYDKTDEGIFISKIVKNSAAGRDGRLVVGHRLLEAAKVDRKRFRPIGDVTDQK